jgi:hypothetical protein
MEMQHHYIVNFLYTTLQEKLKMFHIVSGIFILFELNWGGGGLYGFDA